MKKLFFCCVILMLSAGARAQDWTKNLPQDKVVQGNLSFFDIQKAFNDYWAPFNVKNGRYINNDGQEVKATGWKPFRRWEWYWEDRVDPQTGAFPTTSAWEEYQKYLKKDAGNPKSAGGNWTGIGPTASTGGYAGLGRLNCVAFDPDNTNIIYTGAAAGGFWKSTDGGNSWNVYGDNNATLGVSDICVNPENPDIIYIASGDRESTLFTLNGTHKYDCNSVGVLKSTDAGATWSATGLAFTTSQQKALNRLIMDPQKPDTLYAATSSGVYRTFDAGLNWTQLNGVEYSDLEFKPGDPSILFASTKTGDIYRSSDYGNSWNLQYSSTFERCELAVTPDNPDVVYAVLGKQDSSRFCRSLDGGMSFTVLNTGTPNLLGRNCDGLSSASQWWYDMCVLADPGDANTVFVGGINTWKSIDGGITWNINNHGSTTCGGLVSIVHVDKHYLAYQPGTNHLFEANDGGLYRSTNNGGSWTYIGNGLVTSQIYRLGVAQTSANKVMIGTQDNGTKFYNTGIWDDILSGDGMECFMDYTDENIIYGESQYGELRRSMNQGDTWTDITNGLSGTPYWVTPFVMDPNVPATIYVGYQDVFKSTDRGDTWTKISNWNSTSLRSLTVAPSNSQVICTATRISLFRTVNGGTDWTNITTGIPTASGYITYISIKDDDPNTIWVSLGNYIAQKVYQTVDGGLNWTDISAGLPSVPVMCVIQDRQVTNRVDLYCSSDAGVYYKSGSADWQLFRTGLPNVIMTELEIRYAASHTDSRLYGASYGRGLWVSDLYSTLPAGRSGYWTGSTSSDWDSPANWENHSVPGINDDITIPARHRKPVKTGNLTLGADCRNITLEDGAELSITGNLTVNPGRWLTNGSGSVINVSGNAVFRSDATGMASFVDKGSFTVTGTTTFERYIPANTVAYVSSPVSGATRNVFAGSVNNRLYQYDATTGTWALIPIDATPLEIMRGYVVKYAANTTLQFSGTFNSGSHSASTSGHITLSNGGAFGWNLAGNCYPSALDVGSENDPVSGWTIESGIQGFVSYRKSDGNVAYWNKAGDGTGNNGGTRYIPSTQAFWINLESGSNIGLGTTPSTQVHQTQLPFKNTASNSIFRLQAYRGDYSDECTIGFFPDASDSHDRFDAEKFFINDTSFAMVYSCLNNGRNLAINGQSLLTADRSVVLGFEALKSGPYRFNANVDDLDPTVAVSLEDTQTGMLQDLRANPEYSFTSAAVNTVSRFILHFNTAKINGKVVYDKPDSAPELAGCVVQLLNTAGDEVSRDTTDSEGNFSFSAIPSDCSIRVTSFAPGGGWNSADALDVLRHFTGEITLDSLPLRAADANGNGYVNTVDALCIQKRFIGMINSFIPGEWVFESRIIPVGNPGTTQTVVLKGLHVGDVNKSWE